MRVEQCSSYKTTNSVSPSTKKIGGVSLPDFNDFHFPTKTKPAMSDDKFREAITEQAKKDYAAGKYQNNAEIRNLQKQYVSVVSPDRKGIITKGLTELAKKPSTKNIDYLYLLLFGKVKYEKGSEELSYAEFYDENGELVATYSNTGWHAFGTKAENARETEFNLIYSEAWRNARDAAKNVKNPDMSIPVNSVDEVTFDAKA